jgi:hypothetical protein
MTILVTNDSLGRGIEQAGSALGQALGMRGQRLYQKEMMEEERNRQENINRSQLGALEQALAAIQPDAAPEAQFSTLLNALNQSGVAVSPEMALNYFKALQATNKQNAEPKRPPEDIASFKENQKLLAGIAADAKTASRLLENADAIEEAIKSGKAAGPGLKGVSKKVVRWLTGSGAPPEEQLLETERKNALLALGDLKGIRLTDAKLRFIEESLFNPNKSQEANLQAFNLYKQALNDRITYLQGARELAQSQPELLYDPTFSLRIQDQISPNGQSNITETETFNPKTFADLVRQRRKKQ